MKKQALLSFLALTAVAVFFSCNNPFAARRALTAEVQTAIGIDGNVLKTADIALTDAAVDPLPAQEAVTKGVEWLPAPQAENGGWGAGLHSRQDVRDPRAVQTDPATSAFAAMALMRAGNTLKQGPYRENLRLALDYLLATVENVPASQARITSLTGTQPQNKLGQNIDASMAAQFFSRILPQLESEAGLKQRTELALDKCLSKIQSTQQADGSFEGGTWAGVLQSAMANNALEEASVVGRTVDEVVLAKSRSYQKSNIDAGSGAAKTDRSAGISLYSISSSNRATAQKYQEADQLLREAKAEGRLRADAPLSEASLREITGDDEKAKALIEDVKVYEATRSQMKDEQVLAGFGNNGGEEFLSYMMTSESLAATGGEDWQAWSEKMNARLSKIQNPDGSWSGHHCITSPVFCTSAVILTLTAAPQQNTQVQNAKN